MNRLARNPFLADAGRRLIGGAAGLRAGDVALSDDLALTLRLGATACQVDEAEFVRRAIAEKASRLGLPALMAGMESQAKASEDNGATGPAMNVCPADCVAGEASRVDAGRTASATSEGMDVTGGESAASVSASHGGPKGGKRLQVLRGPNYAAEPDGSEPETIAADGRDVEATVEQRPSATSFLAALNDDGDLIAVPAFSRATIPRFASGP